MVAQSQSERIRVERFYNNNNGNNGVERENHLFLEESDQDNLMASVGDAERPRLQRLNANLPPNADVNHPFEYSISEEIDRSLLPFLRTTEHRHFLRYGLRGIPEFRSEDSNNNNNRRDVAGEGTSHEGLDGTAAAAAPSAEPFPNPFVSSLSLSNDEYYGRSGPTSPLRRVMSNMGNGTVGMNMNMNMNTTTSTISTVTVSSVPSLTLTNEFESLRRNRVASVDSAGSGGSLHSLHSVTSAASQLSIHPMDAGSADEYEELLRFEREERERGGGGDGDGEDEDEREESSMTDPDEQPLPIEYLDLRNLEDFYFNEDEDPYMMGDDYPDDDDDDDGFVYVDY